MLRIEREKKEKAELSDIAALNSLSRGRHYPEEEHQYRLAFERDRDRIIHCSAFRRMEYKTVDRALEVARKWVKEEWCG